MELNKEFKDIYCIMDDVHGDQLIEELNESTNVIYSDKMRKYINNGGCSIQSDQDKHQEFTRNVRLINDFTLNLVENSNDHDSVLLALSLVVPQVALCFKNKSGQLYLDEINSKK